ncbi:MAG: hypothetical protein ACRDV9_08500 [Acidimicrobiia bacterium]
MALRGYVVGEVVDDFADGLMSRREALRQLGLLGLGLAGASAARLRWPTRQLRRAPCRPPRPSASSVT